MGSVFEIGEHTVLMKSYSPVVMMAVGSPGGNGVKYM
jgi:hypothetical protein